MPVAVIADIHGNRVALDAVLAEIDALGLRDVVCGGDLALHGAEPAACVDRLRQRGIPTVQGNTDRAIAAGVADPEADFARDVLGPERVAWLGALPTRLEPLPGVVVVHATPRSDEEALRPETPDAEVAAMLAPEAGARLVLGFHVHLQFARALPDGRRFANPGSVGLPLDGDVRAAWAIVEDDGALDLRRTAYDVDAAIAAVRASGLPLAGTFAGRLARAAW